MKISRLLIGTAVAIVMCALSATGIFSDTAVSAEGRRYNTFSDEDGNVLSLFDCYTELTDETEYFVRDGFLYTKGKCENKFLLKSPKDLSSFTVSADFYPLGEVCPISCGFYIYASQASNAMDSINAYNVQVERDDGNSNYFYLKIHRFKHGWLGAKAEARAKIKGFPIRLTVVADKGHIEAFVEGYDHALLTYDIPVAEATGAVGLRTFRICGSKIGNFCLTADNIDVDFDELNNLLSVARSVDTSMLTQSSAARVVDAVTAGEAALSSSSQAVVDNAVKTLRKAIDKTLTRHSYGELSEKIDEARAIVAAGEGRYTANTFGSLKLILSRALDLNADSDEDVVSETAILLTERINGLTAYIKARR